jgi:osmotically-inducible protein OsmY
MTRRIAARWRAALLATLVATAVGACATADLSHDRRIEAEIKARLVAQADANLTRLGVESTEGTVALTGTVESERHKALAEQVAREVPGVKRLLSTLQVRPTERPAGR